MSKRAEQEALKAYPETLGIQGNGNAFARHYYVEGYEQAEKDLALSWKDIQKIFQIDQELSDSKALFDKEYCMVVLRMFNEQRNK